MSDFHFALSEEEKRFIKELVRWSIRSVFDGPEVHAPVSQSEKLAARLGAFVTLKKEGRLRGCIGHIVGDKPLAETLVKMARAAAMEDPRFPPLARVELDQIEVEISILSPLEKVTDPTLIEPGRHGLLVRRHWSSGLLLPQVAVEWKWDRETFLSQTCRKAGLPGDCWKDPETELFWFEAEVF